MSYRLAIGHEIRVLPSVEVVQGKAWLNRPCVTCAELVSIPFFVEQRWVDEQTVKLMQRALEARHEGDR